MNIHQLNKEKMQILRNPKLITNRSIISQMTMITIITIIALFQKNRSI